MRSFSREGASGFSSSSTAEQVTDDIDATGLTAIVTGANSGIGAETARVLVLRGVHVIMGVRNINAAQDVKEAILKEIPSGKIHVMELDLSSMESVRKFALQFNSSGLPLNILINNAGISATSFMLSKDNIELQFATNHLVTGVGLHMDNQSLQMFYMQMNFHGVSRVRPPSSISEEVELQACIIVKATDPPAAAPTGSTIVPVTEIVLSQLEGFPTTQDSQQFLSAIENNTIGRPLKLDLVGGKTKNNVPKPNAETTIGISAETIRGTSSATAKKLANFMDFMPTPGFKPPRKNGNV